MIEIRETKELEALLEMRREVIENVFGNCDDVDVAGLLKSNRRYYERHLEDGTHVACLAYEAGKLCGSGGVCFYEEMPSPDNRNGRCGYIMNVYVREGYRHRGIAKEIVRWLIDSAERWGAEKIYLESTDMARGLYSGLGFEKMENMMKYEDKEN